MRHYIYGLIDPSDYRVRYVGRTSGRIETRLSEHLAKAHAGDPAPVYEWLRSLAGPPRLVRLETCQGLVPGRQGIRAASVQAEIKWIKRFRRDVLNDIVRESGKRDWRAGQSPASHTPCKQNADGQAIQGTLPTQHQNVG